MNKVLAWVVLLVGIYEALALLIGAIPEFGLGTTWGWIVAVVLIVLGGWMLKKS